MKKASSKKTSEKFAKSEAGGSGSGSPGFVVPRTLKMARDSGLSQVELADIQTALAGARPIAISAATRVPVGHLWRLGEVHGDRVFACYRNVRDTCDWVEVPIGNIPDWIPQ